MTIPHHPRSWLRIHGVPFVIWVRATNESTSTRVFSMGLACAWQRHPGLPWAAKPWGEITARSASNQIGTMGYWGQCSSSGPWPSKTLNISLSEDVTENNEGGIFFMWRLLFILTKSRREKRGGRFYYLGVVGFCFGVFVFGMFCCFFVVVVVVGVGTCITALAML